MRTEEKKSAMVVDALNYAKGTRGPYRRGYPPIEGSSAILRFEVAVSGPRLSQEPRGVASSLHPSFPPPGASSVS